MNEEEQKAIFAKNLNYYIYKSGKQQKEIAKDLGISPTTFNTWCVGKILPNVSKIQRIADYFNIGMSFLVDEKPDERTQSYYLDNETAKIAQEIKDNDNILFDAYKSTSKDRLVAYAKKLMELEKMENGDDY